MNGNESFYTVLPDGLRIVVKAKPGVSRVCVPKIVDLAGSKQALEIAVAAAPEDGKANKALIVKIAEIFAVKRQQVILKAGASSRLKTFEINGDAAALLNRVHQLFQV